MRPPVMRIDLDWENAMIKIVHPIAGALAILAIATFWLSTALSELFGTQAAFSC